MKLFRSQAHSFHLVKPSILPALISIPACLIAFALLNSFAGNSFDWKITVVFILLISVIISWFMIILGETGEGYHTKKVRYGLSAGMLLFIVSEIMFFFAFFWGFFHYSLSPALSVGTIWPPLNTQVLDIWALPLINTVLLLTSGITVTLAHANLLRLNYSGFLINLFWTILLAIFFLLGQFIEYKFGVKFSWKENIYGSIFFITTGFHGLHVTIGTFLLFFCLLRHTIFYFNANFFEEFVSPGGWFTFNLTKRIDFDITNNLFENLCYLVKTGNRQSVKYMMYSKMTSKQHFGFEASAWYWHFVDVVWLFLFTTIYWWGDLNVITF